MTNKFAQRLDVYLKGGQKVTVTFNAEKADVLNPQIEAFMKALGDAQKRESNFLFQGARVVLVRLADVSAADVVSLVREEKAEQPAHKAAKA